MIDNVLRPPLVGKDIEMHPLIVLFATLGGLAVFGVAGFIIGPIIAALFLSVLSIYQHYFRRELEDN
jgi:predicted PurR-regulated permease PerM